MTCDYSNWLGTRFKRRRSIASLGVGIGVALCVMPLGAQQLPDGTAVRPPTLTLLQPSAGASIPSDRPTVFYRYSPGDPTDPVDDGSFQLWVDGGERTAGFRVGNGEAWGTLGAGKPLSPGAHLVIARVCSVRGICAAANDVVIAVPTAAASPDDSPPPSGRRSVASGNHHNHWKQPQTLIGDLVSTIARLFR